MGTFKSGIIIDSIMRRKKAPNSILQSQRQGEVEGKIFSDEWVKHNLGWAMRKESQEGARKAKAHGIRR